jgi:hypothetical protein
MARERNTGLRNTNRPHAGIFVPIELLLAESDDGATCNVTYVVPSSLIAVDVNPQLLSAAKALDAKAEALVASAVIAEVSPLENGK